MMVIGTLHKGDQQMVAYVYQTYKDRGIYRRASLVSMPDSRARSLEAE
jgi:hypothetical protein